MVDENDEILQVYIAKKLDRFVSYRSFRESVQITYHSCSIEGVGLTILQTAKLIAMEICDSENDNAV